MSTVSSVRGRLTCAYKTSHAVYDRNLLSVYNVCVVLQYLLGLPLTFIKDIKGLNLCIRITTGLSASFDKWLLINVIVCVLRNRSLRTSAISRVTRKLGEGLQLIHERCVVLSEIRGCQRAQRDCGATKAGFVEDRNMEDGGLD